MKKLFIIALLMSKMSIYAMEKEPVSKTISDKKIVIEQLSEKKQALKNAHENYIFVLKNNLPSCFESTYKSYQDLVQSLGGNLGETLINPYLLVAQYIKDNSVQKMVNLLNKRDWPVNAEKSIGYHEYSNPDKSITYLSISPMGYSIQYDNKYVLSALHFLKADCRAIAWQKGKKYSVFNSPAAYIPENKYNAFEFAIHEGKGELAQTICGYDPTIVREGNPLKIAVQVAAKDERGKDLFGLSDYKSIFTSAHNLVIKHKPLFDHSLLNDACITYCHAGVAAEMMGLGYKIDASPSGPLASFLSSTITDKIINFFKNIETASFSAKQIAALIILMNDKKKFSDGQNVVLAGLVKEYMKIDNPSFNGTMSEKKKEELRMSKGYVCATYIMAATTKSTIL